MADLAPFKTLIFLYLRDNQEILYAVLRRRDNGFWQPVTGCGEVGETSRQTAERELFEETGINPEGRMVDLEFSCDVPVEIAFEHNHWGPDLTHVPQHVFALETPGSELTLSSEHSEYRWVPFDEAVEFFTLPANRDALVELNRRLRSSD